MTKAADALGIGQPHVSRAVAQLEAELGFALFIRGHGSATPTVEGEAFAREVERTYAGSIICATPHVRSGNSGRDPLKVACQPSLASRLLPRAIRRLGMEYPGARVALHVPAPDTIWSWVASGQCDLGIGGGRPRSGYVASTASRSVVDAVCALPIGHALAQAPFVTGAGSHGRDPDRGRSRHLPAIGRGGFGEAATEPRFLHMAQYTAARWRLGWRKALDWPS